MRRRTFLGLGVVCVAGGALHETGAFTSTEANRQTSISTAADSAALLGIVGTGPEKSLSVTNNLSEAVMNVELDAVEENIVYKIDGSDVPDPTTFELLAGESQKVLFESTDGRKEVTIQFTATLFEDGVEKGEISIERTVEIPQAEQIALTANVSATGGSGTFNFEIENTGEVDIVIEAMAINETSADAIEVNNEINSENAGSISGPIPVLNRVPEEDDFQYFDTPPGLDVGDEDLFEMNKFMRDRGGGGGRPHADMRGERVVVTVLLGDGSTAELDMEDE